MSATVTLGDCLQVLPTLDADSVDAIVTDPPYHLTTGKKGGSGQAPENLNSPAGRSRAGTGFMGKKWDGGDVAHDPALWREVLRVAKPGAYLVAFGGCRTSHRLICAIEDAGWEIRDSLCWIFGSGFPKSHNLPGGFGTALKPAHEPICLARKPLIGTVAANVTEHGTGALNIDGCRIEGPPAQPFGSPRKSVGGILNGTNEPREQYRPSTLGRWPANVVLDEAAARLLDAMSGERPAKMGGSAPKSGHWGNSGEGQAIRRDDTGGASRFYYCAKAPSNERWGILLCDCQAAKLEAWESPDQNPNEPTVATLPERAISGDDSTDGCAMSTMSSGNGHMAPSRPAGKSTTSTRTSKTTASKTSDSSVPPNTSASTEDASCAGVSGGSHVSSAATESPSASSTGISPRKATRSMGVVGPVTSLRSSAKSNCENCGKPFQVESHPTQKPLSLMRWLCRLVTPPGGLILDPFAGSGSTGCAAVLEGFRFLGIEREAEYVEIARRRIAHTLENLEPDLFAPTPGAPPSPTEGDNT